MAKTTPKVIMVGKGSTETASRIQNILAGIEPSQIPKEVLHSVNVEMSDLSKYKVDKKFLSEGLDYDNIGKHLSKMGLTQDVSQIEVVIDLDVADRILARGMRNLLSPYFNM